MQIPKKKKDELDAEIQPLYAPPVVKEENIQDMTLRKAKKKVSYGALTASERLSMGY